MTSEPKPKSKELIIKEGRTRKLAYAPEFKKESALSPGAIRKFLELQKTILPFDRGKEFENGEIRVTLLRGAANTRRYKVIISGKPFFVKEVSKEAFFRGGGAKEAVSSHEASKILEAN